MKRKINKTTASTTGIPLEHSVQIRLAYQVSGLRGDKLLERFRKYCKATIYKHAKMEICGKVEHDKRKSNRGRPRKLSERDSRQIIRKIAELRNTDGSFTSKKVQLAAGLTHVSNRTVRRVMNENNYKYCRSRKKGLLLRSDLVKRVKYCKNIRKQGITQDYWRYDISFYFDGTGFAYKQNPMDQAFAPKAREWRKPNEGLHFGCTAKGKKEGTKQANSW